jgi:hypothetical protein
LGPVAYRPNNMDERLRQAQINHGGAKYLVIKEPYFLIQGVYDRLIPG